MYQRIGKAAYKANLNNTLALDKYFKHPHKKFKSIHVAGTNGKGSVSHMLSSVLQSAGYKVGLYTSPHLLDFRERIRINGEMIPENEVVDFVGNHKGIINELKPSFFEMTVAMAFECFARKGVDIAIIEVGLGGRLDSTNIIIPELSIITNIGYDHMTFLGDTLYKIAVEKAGIIKTRIPVIIGETQDNIKSIFINKAKEKITNITFADQKYTINYSLVTLKNQQAFNIEKDGKKIFEQLKTDLLGEYQKQNVITTICAIENLQSTGWKINNEDIICGFANISKKTGFAGRWQIIGYNPLIVCDTAHNVDGIKKITDQISNTSYKNLHIVFGMVDDKTIDPVLSMLPVKARYYFTKASVPRALNENVLAQNALKHNLKGLVFPDVKRAIIAARQNSDKRDMIFIGGSTFVVADALA